MKVLVALIIFFIIVFCFNTNNTFLENFNINKLNIMVPPNAPQGLHYKSDYVKDIDPEFNNLDGGNICFPKLGFKYDGIWESKLRHDGVRDWNLNTGKLVKGKYCGTSPSFQFNSLYLPQPRIISKPDCNIPGKTTPICCV